MVQDLFAATQHRIAAGTLSALELMGTSDQLCQADAPDLALQLYAAWIAGHPDDPLRHAMLFNQAALLSSGADLAGAKRALDEAIALAPEFMPARLNLGFVQERLGARADAVATWMQVTQHLHAISRDAVANKKIALKQLGRVLELAHFDPNAEATLRASLELDPHQRDVAQHWLSLRQRQCEWPIVEPVGDLDRRRLLKCLSPLSLAAHSDDPLFQLANAAQFSRRDIVRPDPAVRHEADRLLAQPETGALRVGYLSSDLREHAIGLLMAELFEQHDPGAVQVFAFYCGPPADDAVFQRIRAAAHWTDISALTDDQAAHVIAECGIQILVDVNGYTHGARSSLLALRPAPVLVNWLGFPATTGNPDHHYIIADDVIVPPDHAIYYSESVVRLPCYQPNDRRRVVSARVFTRTEAGLPPDAIVFCCFNGAHKFTPFTWARWMSILHRVPGSVLWLMQGVPTTDERLRQLAVAHGITAERLVFAPRLSNPDHLARYVLADLFLDTTPYGAHTTASDALWMGVPVLTLAGRSFAARVCASLVTAAGLPELVCATPDGYVEQAVALGHDTPRLAALSQFLRATRDSCVLFDTPLLARRLESLFRQMWQDARDGRRPRPDLANLDLYLDIGISLQRDDSEMLAVADYQGLYLEALRSRDRICMVREDSRLWRPRCPEPPACPSPARPRATARA